MVQADISHDLVLFYRLSYATMKQFYEILKIEIDDFFHV